jgi:hypothetical protein
MNEPRPGEALRQALHYGARDGGYCNPQARFAVDWLQIQRRGNYWLNF